jgi:hypothetical protein
MNMTGSIQNQTFGKALRPVVCATLSFALTGITTELIVSSAGQHEYAIASSNLTASHTTPDISRRMTVAQVR